ncbi:MAG: sigma-70 family RNA polymerase sigma factor [Bacteroidales bacterium]|nr:sigma-70 family RNA polymerase sigma factor [Bacteroidales bacterium]
MQALSDIECIRMVLRGEKGYFAFLVEKYQDKAYSLCYKILRNKEDARDAAQEAFIKAYEALPTFRLDSAFSTWFYRILYNVCISKIRKERFMSALEPEDPAWNHRRNDNDAIGQLDLDDMKKMLVFAYEALSTDEIFLTEQFYREECSIEELSGMTGLSQSNVKVKLFRARQKMNEKIRSVIKEEVYVWQTK